MKKASIYVLYKLTEIELLAHFVHKLHDNHYREQTNGWFLLILIFILHDFFEHY
jgi:hypothetical protein